jgi:hypothetical protein
MIENRLSLWTIHKSGGHIFHPADGKNEPKSQCHHSSLCEIGLQVSIFGLFQKPLIHPPRRNRRTPPQATNRRLPTTTKVTPSPFVHKKLSSVHAPFCSCQTTPPAVGSRQKCYRSHSIHPLLSLLSGLVTATNFWRLIFDRIEIIITNQHFLLERLITLLLILNQ